MKATPTPINILYMDYTKIQPANKVSKLPGINNTVNITWITIIVIIDNTIFYLNQSISPKYWFYTYSLNTTAIDIRRIIEMAVMSFRNRLAVFGG